MTGAKYTVRRLRPSDYDKLLYVWERAGLPARPKGRDSRKELTRQMGLGTSIYLKVVVKEGSKEKICQSTSARASGACWSQSWRRVSRKWASTSIAASSRPTTTFQ
jgi:hypothetical protein